MEKPEVIDNLQRALLELEYAVADFSAWQAGAKAASPEVGELERVLFRAVELARIADTLMLGLRVEA